MSDEHLNVALARLKRRYGVAVSVQQPTIAYRESIRKAVTQRGRHKKQSGGHGQFGDVVLEVRPLERGEGLRFEEQITGGAIPKQWIPAVEKGVRQALADGATLEAQIEGRARDGGPCCATVPLLSGWKISPA